MKDELKAEMKLIDDKMYIVAESDNGEDDN